MAEATRASHKYVQIYNAIRSDIILNLYQDGSLLPTEAQLMEKYGASRNTVRKAVSMLQNDGFISTRQGSGSVVCARAHLTDCEGYTQWSSTACSTEYYNVDPATIQVSPAALDTVPASEQIADLFQIPTGSEIYRVQRIWNIECHPYNYMVQYLNPKLMPDYPSHMDESRKLYPLLERYWGLHYQGSEEHITCQNAGFLEANLLNVELHSALLLTRRIARCEQGVFEIADFYGNPKYTGYVIQIANSPSVTQQ